MHRDVILWSGITPSSRFERNQEEFSVSRPLGSYQVAYWLRKFRFQVQVVEFIQLMTADEIVALTEPFITPKTICIGISRSFLGPGARINERLIAAAAILKERYPHLKFVTGGQYHPRYNQGLHIDKTFAGYGEDEFAKWCQEQKYGVSMLNPMFEIKQLEHRFIADDIILPNEMLPIELGRGCIFKCKFCSYSMIGKEKGSYLREHQLLLDEMKYNRDTFGTDKYCFADDTCNEDYDKVRRFATFEKDLGFPISWVGYLRADLIWAKKESAEHLLESGLISPFYGIETFNRKDAQYIGKGWSGKHAMDWLPELHHNIWKNKISAHVSLIFGFPNFQIDEIATAARWWNKNAFGRIAFRTLVINASKPEGREDKRSEMSKDAEKLGYVFEDQPTSDGFWHWKSPVTSSRELLTMTAAAEVATEPRCKPACWTIANGLNFGMTLEEVRKAKGRIFYDVTFQKRNFLKQRYITQFAKHFGLNHLLENITSVSAIDRF